MYKKVLEALGAMKRKTVIYNMFNTVLAQSDDKKLRELTKAAIDGLMSSGTKTEITPFKDFNSVDTHNLHRYCLQKAYSSTDEKYEKPWSESNCF